MKKVTLLLVLTIVAYSCVSAQKLDSVLNSISQLTDSAKVDSVIRLSRLCSIASDGDCGLLYAKWALKKAKENQFKDLIPKARFYLAAAYDDLGENDSCAKNYDRALEELKGTKHANWDVYVHTNSVATYRNTGQYEKALNAGFKGLKYFEEKDDSSSIARFYTDIGYVYDRMQDFDKAIEWHRKALSIFSQLEDEYNIYFVKSRIGIAYDDLEVFDSAHHYNLQTLAYHILQEDSFEIAQISSNIGNTYIKQKKWNKALEYLVPAYETSKTHGDFGSFAIASINLGNVYAHLGEYTKAKKHLKEGVASSSSWGGKKFESEAYYRFHELFEKQAIYDSSLYYYKKYEALEDSLYNLKKAEQIEEISTKYETEKKEQQIEYQKVSLQEKESKLEARQRTIFALIILSALIVVLAFGGYKRFKAKKNAELQRRIIEEQEKGLNAVLHAQEEERKRISKDLHDGVGQQLSGLKMAFQKLSKSLKLTSPEHSDEIEKLSDILTESADEVRSISHQMMPRALVEFGLIEAVEDMLSKSLSTNNIEYEFEHYGINERLVEQKEVSLYRICQELINNVIKHSNANHVSIQLFKNAGKVIMIVEDNGKGIKGANYDGHGLMNIKSRLSNLKGEVNFEPSPSSGTLATIRIPL